MTIIEFPSKSIVQVYCTMLPKEVLRLAQRQGVKAPRRQGVAVLTGGLFFMGNGLEYERSMFCIFQEFTMGRIRETPCF